MLRFVPIAIYLATSACASAATDTIGAPSEIHWPWESRYQAISMSPPIMPYEARRQHLTVRGIIAVDIDTRTGLVTAAAMQTSTGSTILDHASLSVTKKWRFRPGASSHLAVPVHFGIEGGRLE